MSKAEWIKNSRVVRKTLPLPSFLSNFYGKIEYTGTEGQDLKDEWEAYVRFKLGISEKSEPMAAQWLATGEAAAMANARAAERIWTSRFSPEVMQDCADWFNRRVKIRVEEVGTSVGVEVFTCVRILE